MVTGSERLEPLFSKNFPRRIGRIVQSPADIALMLRIGLFILLLPNAMRNSDLPGLFKKMHRIPGPSTQDLDSAVARIARLRQPWFRLPFFKARNTCYTRALTLYRFLNLPAINKRIHIGVEPPRAPGERTRGHAWVTVDRRLLEPPDPVVAGRVKELYAYPPE